MSTSRAPAKSAHRVFGVCCDSTVLGPRRRGSLGGPAVRLPQQARRVLRGEKPEGLVFLRVFALAVCAGGGGVGVLPQSPLSIYSVWFPCRKIDLLYCLF